MRSFSLSSTGRRRAVALLVAAALFMENFDATVIATALPTMASDFGTAAAHLSVGVSAYLVAVTVFIPISGWIAERWGPRRVFCSAVIVFVLSSLLCALSRDLLSFTGARILQGIGGAMMVPVGRLLVLRDTPKEGILRAVATLTWPALFAPILGPPVGGWISTQWSWHWIFVLNLPLGAMALLAALWFIRSERGQKTSFDFTGFVLTGLTFGLFMAGIETVSRADISKYPALALLGASLVLLWASVRHLQRAPYPLFGLQPLNIRTFRITALGGSLCRTAIGTAPFLLPLMFQLGFGWSPVQAGVLLLWLFAGNLAMKPATTRIMQILGFKRVLVVNGFLVALSFAAYALFTANTPYWLICTVLFLSGMARSMQLTAINTIGFADIPQAQMRDATTLFSVLQRMSGGTGIAVGALSLSIGHWLNSSNANQAVLADYRVAYWLIAGLALLAVIDSITLPVNAGERILARQ